MKLNVVIAAVSLALAGAASASGIVAYPGESLGTLSPAPALYGNLLATSNALGSSFGDDFFFDLAIQSELNGSVGSFFGSVSFTSVLIDGNPLTLTGTQTGFGFSYGGLAAGTHVLSVGGAYAKGQHAYTGSLYLSPAVPEPASLALALVGLGVMGLTGLVARRPQCH